MVKKEWAWMYFNDEWNEPTTDNDEGDEDFVSNVDFIEDKKVYDDYDVEGGYEEYGN